MSPAVKSSATLGRRSRSARAYRTRRAASPWLIRNAAPTSAATASMVSIAQSSVSEQRDNRYTNNSPIATSCAAAARFSARAEEQIRSTNTADSAVADGWWRSINSSKRAITSARGHFIEYTFEYATSVRQDYRAGSKPTSPMQLALGAPLERIKYRTGL